jgi:hypothetical protein
MRVRGVVLESCQTGGAGQHDGRLRVDTPA